MLGDKIKNLRKNEGLTQQALSNAIGVSRSAIGMLEKNLQGVGNETLIKLANFFNVSVDFLSNNSEIDSCPICGLSYCPLEKEDFEIHKIRHNNFLKFPERSLFLTYTNREVIKRKCHEILKNNNSSITEKIDAAIKLFQCWYARSIDESDFSTTHPSFNEYIAMMLNRKKSKDELSIPVYNTLVETYGTKEGIPSGESYAPLKVNYQNTKEEIALLENYNKLNEIGKNKLIEYSNDLIDTPKYVDIKNNITQLIASTKEENYAFAAHDDELDEQTKKKNIQKAKAIFKQMDDE